MISDDFIFSQSNLRAFTDCPRKFELTYLQKLDWPAQKYQDTEIYELDLAAGADFHQAVNRYMLGMEAEALLDWAEAGKDPRVAVWFRNFLKAFPSIREVKNSASEYLCLIPFQTYRLMAKFDLLVLDDGNVEILDWKTSTKQPQPALLANSLQTKVYQFVAHQFLSTEKRLYPQMRYWEANFPKLNLSFASDPGKIERYSQDLQKLIFEISNTDKFEKTENLKHCQFCRYRSFCNRGTVPGMLADDESEPSDETTDVQAFDEI